MRLWLATAFCAASLASCRNQESEQVSRTPAPAVDAAPKSVGYEGDVAALLKDKCVSCHGPDDDVDLSTYDAARRMASDLAAAVKAGTMPPAGPLAKAEKELVVTWVKGGTPRKAPKPSTSFTLEDSANR